MSPVLTPITILGAAGMLGRAWRELCDRHGLDHRDLDVPQIDITDPTSIADVLGDQAGTVVNCAAFTDVDGAEEHEDVARRVNGEAVGHLAAHAHRTGATLVHYSTDYVFDGQASEPYPIDHPRDPLNAYGRTKAVGEETLERSPCRSLLVRTSWLYAPWAKNFVRTIARAARLRDELQVVHDQIGRPTSAEHLAATTLTLLEAEATGVFHVTDGGQCSWYEFACAIAAHANPDCRVAPCTSDVFPRPAKRPAYSVLDLSRTEALVGPMPTWTENLADVLRRLEPLES
jgi:dTDP-4-dehydrorhamnose reductase